MIIDTNESTQHPAFKEAFPDASIKQILADFQIGNVLIERKSFPDLLGSVWNKHINQQVQEMLDAKPDKIFLIVEGDMNFFNIMNGQRVFSDRSANQVYARLVEFSLMGVHIIPTKNLAHTILVLGFLEKKYGKKIEYKDFTRSRRIHKPADLARQMLMDIPGIGKIYADKILKPQKLITYFDEIAESKDGDLSAPEKILKKALNYTKKRVSKK